MLAKRPDRVALSVLATHNLTQNLLFRESGYVVSNLVVTGGLLVVAHTAGLDRNAVGLGPGDLRRGGSVGVPPATAALLGAAIAPRVPSLASRLRDERLPAADTVTEAMRTAMVRFPLGTALFEEVAFRGILPPLLARDADPVTGDLRSAAVFALWHLIPTHRALTVNRVGATGRARLAGTVLGAAAAGLAGWGLSRIRRWTGSLLAPWLIHSSVNAASYLAVSLARLRD